MVENAQTSDLGRLSIWKGGLPDDDPWLGDV